MSVLVSVLRFGLRTKAPLLVALMEEFELVLEGPIVGNDDISIELPAPSALNSSVPLGVLTEWLRSICPPLEA